VSRFEFVEYGNSTVAVTGVARENVTVPAPGKNASSGALAEVANPEEP
jgi:hypothetical protein